MDEKYSKRVTKAARYVGSSDVCCALVSSLWPYPCCQSHYQFFGDIYSDHARWIYQEDITVLALISHFVDTQRVVDFEQALSFLERVEAVSVY